MTDSPGEQRLGTGFGKGLAWVGEVLQPVEYAEVDGQAVVEGCIVLGPVEAVEKLTLDAEAAVARGVSVETFGSGIKQPRYRWPNATMAYRIDPALPDPDRVHEAMAHWTERTGFKFFSTDETADMFVTFRGGYGCSSNVGCQGGEQFITLGPECTKGNVIHEIGHAIGLWHEQSRIDRDEWVEIVKDNIAPDYHRNFEQHLTDGLDLVTYDFGSIMHYPPNAFALDPNKPTIVAKKGDASSMGQRTGLSDRDVESVRLLYLSLPRTDAALAASRPPA